MIKLKDILKEVKTKDQLVKLFSQVDLLDNGKYKNLLIHYIESQHNLDAGEFKDLVNWLIQNKSNYPTLLKPKSGFAYRGTSITPEQFQKIKNNPTTKEEGYTVIQAPYQSASETQSWTYDFKIAQRFADKGIYNNPRLEKGGRAAIIRVKIDESFVGNPKLTNPIADRLSLKSEKEIFHLGKQIDNAEWMIPTADLTLGKFN
jgi:hypothetical protein